jgi:hypothetical protein
LATGDAAAAEGVGGVGAALGFGAGAALRAVGGAAGRADGRPAGAGLVGAAARAAIGAGGPSAVTTRPATSFSISFSIWSSVRPDESVMVVVVRCSPVACVGGGDGDDAVRQSISKVTSIRTSRARPDFLKPVNSNWPRSVALVGHAVDSPW